MNAFYSNAFVRRRCDGSRHGPGFFTLQMNEFEPDFSSSTCYDDLQPAAVCTMHVDYQRWLLRRGSGCSACASLCRTDGVVEPEADAVLVITRQVDPRYYIHYRLVGFQLHI